jgi:hypothetical protein
MEQIMFKGFLQKTKNDRKKGKLIIGVCSTHPGAGATHFSMLLATYFSEWLGIKTAYINFKDTEGFNLLKEYFLKNKEKNDSNFTVGRITFYNKDNLNKLSEIIGGEADCIILDMGHEFLENKNEFLRCDLKIVISSLAVWKQDKLKKFLETVNNSFAKTDWKYVITFVDEKAFKEGMGIYRINLWKMPYQPDPFTIQTVVVRFFDSLLQK